MEKGESRASKVMQISPFFTDTRIRRCLALKCRFNAAGQCNLKQVVLDHEARCTSFEEKSERVIDAEKLELESYGAAHESTSCGFHIVPTL